MQFDLRTMAEHLGGVAWGVLIVLALMSIYSIGVMIERYYTYSQATKQSRKYAPEVARFLKQGKIKEAIDASHGTAVKHSHLAKVLVVGLQEWQYQQEIGEAERDKDAAVDAAKRAIQRATAVNLADLKRGLSGLATIGSTAPFVGLFGTTFVIITPMLQKGVDVRLPTAGHTKEKKDEPKTITVAIRKDTSTFLGGVKVEKQADLVPRLKERLEDVPEGSRIVYLKADAELPY